MPSLFAKTVCQIHQNMLLSIEDISLMRQKIPHVWGTPRTQSLGTGGPPKMGDFFDESDYCWNSENHLTKLVRKLSSASDKRQPVSISVHTPNFEYQTAYLDNLTWPPSPSCAPNSYIHRWSCCSRKQSVKSTKTCCFQLNILFAFRKSFDQTCTEIIKRVRQASTRIHFGSHPKFWICCCWCPEMMNTNLVVQKLMLVLYDSYVCKKGCVIPSLAPVTYASSLLAGTHS